MNKQISVKDLELLSAYLDRQLSPAEMINVETRLSEDSGFQTALAGLKRTKMILAALPVKPVPRNFSLPSQTKKSGFNIVQYFQVFRFSTAAALLCLLLLFLMDFLSPSARTVSQQDGRNVLAPAYALSTPQSEAQSVIIIWETPQPAGLGRGGGGGGVADTAVANNAQATIPQPMQAPAMLGSSKVATEQASPSPSVIPSQLSSITEAPPVTGTGPFLGVPPTAERGILPTVSPLLPTGTGESNNTLGIVEIGLAVIAFISALTAIWLHRKLP